MPTTSSAPTDTIVYKILPQDAWDAACSDARYDGSADDRRDGFIHFSTAAQLAGTAAKYFRGQTNLVLVAIDAARLGAALKWEPSRGGMLFPHLYGFLDPATALSVTPLPLGADGVPIVPESLSPC